MVLKHVLLVSTMIATLAGGYAQAQQSSVSNQRVTQDQPDGQGTQIYASSAGVRQIQQALTQKGYSTGAVDGRWNSQTAAAARSFQQAQNMEPTGTLTIPLVYGLGLEQDIILGNRDRQGAGQSGDQGAKQADNQRIAVERTDSPGEPIWMNADGVRQIQQVLNQRGYAAGHLDGNWNTDTTIAATHFQQAQGLEPTGTLTTNLLASLGMSRWERGEFLGGMTARANMPGNPNPQATGSFNAAGGPGGSGSGAAESGSAKSDAPAGQGSGDARAVSGTR